MFRLSIGLAIYLNITSVPVPMSCVDLALREGFPTDYLNERQLADARARMHQLSKRDPIVKACKDAIEEIRRMQRQGI